MEIRTGRYKTESGKIVVIGKKIQRPIPYWQGHIEGSSTERADWTNEGQEMSGHKPWNLVERIEESEDNSVRWNLQCIPQVVTDLTEYYRILALRKDIGEDVPDDIIREG